MPGQARRKGLRDDAQEEAPARTDRHPQTCLPAGPRTKSPAGRPRSEQDDHHKAKMAKPPNPSQIRVVIVIIPESQIRVLIIIIAQTNIPGVKEDREEEPGTPKKNNNIGNPTEPGSERVDALGTPHGQM